MEIQLRSTELGFKPGRGSSHFRHPRKATCDSHGGTGVGAEEMLRSEHQLPVLVLI